MLAEISHYRVQEKIGEGGMGVVFRAFDTRLNRPVALKFLTKESLEHVEARNRLLREARAASALNHNNIAVIHDIDDSIDHTFIAMEYVEGDTIRDRIKRGPLSMLDSLDYAAQIADALSEAHSKLIVHRDIKSSNVVIKPNGQVKVLDFGLAKFQPPPDTAESQISTISTLTQTGSVLGTAAYMSPEQLRCEEIDGRSDIFSLGVVLYEMLSGRRPFERSTQVESFGATLHEMPTPISDYVKNVPPSISRILDKCLEKDKTKRYQVSADLRHDLLKAREDIVSGSVKFLDMIRSTKRKPRTWQAMMLTVTALVAVTLSVLAYTAIAGHWPWTSSRPFNIADYKRIAVMPVKQLSKGNEESEVLAQSLKESLVAGLTKNQKGFSVLTALATERYRDTKKDERTIGKELGTDGLVETTMQESNGHLKLRISLVRCNDNSNVWTSDPVDIYDRGEFSAQDRALSLVDKMVGEPANTAVKALSPRPDQQAYHYYERGKIAFNRLSREGLDEAVDSYQESIIQDKNFALAHAALSTAYAQYINLELEDDPKYLNWADDSADTAIRIDQTLPEARYARGRAHYYRFLYFNTGDLAQAEREIKEALDFDQDYAPALHLLTAINLQKFRSEGGESYLTQAYEYYQRANRLEPNVGSTEANIALVLAYQKDFDGAINHLRRLEATAPEYPQTHGRLAAIYALKLDYANALDEMRKYLEIHPSDPAINAWIAVYMIHENQLDDAEKCIGTAESSAPNNYSAEYFLTLAYASLKDSRSALKHFETFANLMENKKYYARGMVRQLMNDPNFEAVRSDPEFLAIEDKILK